MFLISLKFFQLLLQPQHKALLLHNLQLYCWFCLQLRCKFVGRFCFLELECHGFLSNFWTCWRQMSPLWLIQVQDGESSMNFLYLYSPLLRDDFLVRLGVSKEVECDRMRRQHFTLSMSQNHLRLCSHKKSIIKI